LTFLGTNPASDSRQGIVSLNDEKGFFKTPGSHRSNHIQNPQMNRAVDLTRNTPTLEATLSLPDRLFLSVA
jgi:hypothetical protein